MYPAITALARKSLKEGLSECSDAQQLVFKRMYANGNLDMPINDVVDRMNSDELGWALEQVLATIKKNEKRELDFYAAVGIVNHVT